ncbi:MAG: hypothetical protein LBU32_23350 [Clostridiales bacterium]|jgi:hypothetical protein|nr:hypothetical protein [Clostridiales bacterium]
MPIFPLAHHSAAYALGAKDASLSGNTLQFAWLCLPLTLLDEDSFTDEDGFADEDSFVKDKTPQLADYGVQANKGAVNSFFGSGVHENPEEAIIPPEIWQRGRERPVFLAIPAFLKVRNLSESRGVWHEYALFSQFKQKK